MRYFRFFLLLNFIFLQAQNFYFLDSIHVSGNRKTKYSIIARECPLRKGDSIPESSLQEIIQETQKNLMRTQLFVYDSVHYRIHSDNKIHIYIIVKERWYIIPATYLSFLDRNINAWWLNRDWKRILVGCYLVVDNTTGNKDRLYVHLGYGYNQVAGIVYRFPYLNKKQTLGMRIEYTFSRSGNMQYGTSSNKQQTYYSPFPYLLQEQTAGLSLLFRPATLYEHKWDLYLKNNRATDTLFWLQPDYFPDKKKNFSFLNTGYVFQFDNRNNKFNPQEGFSMNYSLDVWFGLNRRSQLFSRHQLMIQQHYSFFKNRFFISLMGAVRKTMSENYPGYFVMKGLGYGTYTVRGYEYFIMDGGDFVFFRSTFRYALLPLRFFKLSFRKFLHQFNTIPFSLELTAFADAGQTFNRYNKIPEGFLDKRVLNPGYGIGIQISSYYDFVMRLEYSFTPYLRGFYLGFGSGF